MAFGSANFMILLVIIIFKENYVENLGHFPLKNCSGDALDILGLVDYPSLNWQDYSSSLRVLYLHFADFDFSSNVPRVMIATVIDRSITHTASMEVSSWSFYTAKGYGSVYIDTSTSALQYRVTDVLKVVELKIQFAERLFKEMRGVRELAIHVGIIFLDGTDYTQEDVRNVPDFIQQRNSKVKIFAVIMGYKFATEIVHLKDTVVVPTIGHTKIVHILLMAICKRCLPDWESRGQVNLSTNAHSCYKFVVHENMEWSNAMTMCNTLHGGFLARIETVEELIFVRKLLIKKLKERTSFNNVHNHTADVYIGLSKDFTNYAKRFKWYTLSREYLPLVIQHWLPGEPRYFFGSSACGAWRFYGTWNNDRRVNKTDTVSEGWLYVYCYGELSMSLCEVTLPQQVDINNIISGKAASQQSFDTSLAKGDFLPFEDNIVSVYENVRNKDFIRSFRETKPQSSMFDCEDDTGQQLIIPYSLVCDHVNHCNNRRDEMFCFHPDKLYPQPEQQCAPDRRCLDGSCLSILWLNDGEVDCHIYITYTRLTDENPVHDRYLKAYESCALICNYDTCINMSQLNDGVNDCRGPDGALDETIGKLPAVNSCTSIEGKFTWSPRCVYIKDMYGGVIGCRDMSHLRYCEDFQCGQGYVKCYNSYCIPQHYLLDRKADCPTGEDEQPFSIGRCTGNFACWDSKVCLHADFVCDGHADCPHKDDELNCNTLCPEGFRCTAGTVSVVNHSLLSSIDLDSFTNIDMRTMYLDMSGIDLSQIEDFFYQVKIRFANLVVLFVSKCNISNLNVPEKVTLNQHSPINIQSLDISYNMIHEIFSTEVFNNTLPYIHNLNASYNKRLVSLKYLQFTFLEVLDLSHTGLSYLHHLVFAGLPGLQHLNLSYTLISDFNRQYFPAIHTLHTLDLRGLLIQQWETDLFHGVAISHTLYTDQFQICCPKVRGPKIPAHACQSPADAISSCFDLIGLFVQRVLLWLVAVLSVLGNTAVIVYRVVWDRSVLKKGYGLFVTNLGIADFIMGVYLSIIAGADYFYRDNYVLYDRNWRESVACSAAGFMATLSHETSTLFTFLITLDRFFIMKFPFGQIYFSRFCKIVTVILVWVIGLLLSLIPILLNFTIYSSNAMCLGLPLTNKQSNGWLYSVAVFIIFNFIMFILIAYGQCAIFRAMSENRIPKTTTSMSRSRRAEDITVAKQLSLVVLSNFLCWFPIGVMGLMSLGDREVSDEVYAWTTVILLPINSAANPVLYTIPALMARWEQFKSSSSSLSSSALKTGVDDQASP